MTVEACLTRYFRSRRRQNRHEAVTRIAERTSDHPETAASRGRSVTEGAIERLTVKDVRTLFDHIHTRPGMWFIEPSFRVTAAFISGYDEGRGREPLRGFREWLIVRLKWGSNLGWESLVLRAAFPHVDAPEELLVPGSREDRLAINMLFELFAAFDDVRSSPGGLARILEAHEAYV